MNRMASSKWRSLVKRMASAAPDGWTVIAGIASVNLLLAVTAFLKDVLFAGYFGTTATADAVNAALLLPDAIGSNLVGYVLGIAAVPHLSRILASDRSSEFLRTAAGLTLQCSLVLFLLGVVFYGFERPIMGWFGYTERTEFAGLMAGMFRLLIPCLVLMPIAAVGSAALQTLGSFYVPAFAPVLINAAMLLGLALSWAGSVNLETGGWVFSASVLLGSVIAVLYVWSRLVAETRKKGSYPPQKQAFNAGKLLNLADFLPVYRDFGPLFMIILLTQCLYAAERILASGLETGTLAGLNYAYRIAQFPNWVFIAALTSVILPAMSRTAGQSSALREVLRALKLTGLVMVPVALLLCLARTPIVALLLGRGAFGSESVAVTSGLLAGYSLSVVGQAVSAVCLRYFLANGKLSNVVWVYLAAVLLSVGFDVYACPRYGPVALGYGALLGWSVNAAWMAALLIRDARNAVERLPNRWG